MTEHYWSSCEYIGVWLAHVESTLAAGGENLFPPSFCLALRPGLARRFGSTPLPGCAKEGPSASGCFSLRTVPGRHFCSYASLGCTAEGATGLLCLSFTAAELAFCAESSSESESEMTIGSPLSVCLQQCQVKGCDLLLSNSEAYTHCLIQIAFAQGVYVVAVMLLITSIQTNLGLSTWCIEVLDQAKTSRAARLIHVMW